MEDMEATTDTDEASDPRSLRLSFRCANDENDDDHDNDDDDDDDDVSTILVPGGRLVMKLDISSSKV